MRHLSRLISGLLLSLSWGIGAMAAPLPFTDISPTDSYYQSLQTLYDGGIITDTSDHLFRPSEQMDRDLYVSLVVGVGCRQCLTPSVEDYLRYTTDPFIDLPKTNPYYYCISYAKEKEIVQGYRLDASGVMQCENTTIWRSPPFCAQNTITRIEAVAVLLRRASLWSDTLNAGNYERKKEISDVSPYWYGYAQKGVEADLITIKNNGTIGADEKMSRAEFVTMAAKILSLNQCTTTNPAHQLESEIRVSDSATGIETSETTPTKSITLTGFPQSQTGSYSYSWTLTRVGSDESRSYSSATIPSILLSEGIWVARLTVTDVMTRKTSSSVATIVSRERGNTQSQLGVEIRANPLSVNIGEPIDFSSIVSGGSGSISYLWQLGDGGSSSEKNPIHTYQNPGTYTVTLLVRDTSGNTSIAQIVVRVGGDRDTDKDRIPDTRDLCPLVMGIAPTGCPDIPVNHHRDILIEQWNGGVTKNLCYGDIVKTRGMIIGSTQCLQCPCETQISILDTIRECDILFPTILSPDKQTMYSRGGLYQVR